MSTSHASARQFAKRRGKPRLESSNELAELHEATEHIQKIVDEGLDQVEPGDWI